jgi:hypothetical protein
MTSAAFLDGIPKGEPGPDRKVTMPIFTCDGAPAVGAACAAVGVSPAPASGTVTGGAQAARSERMIIPISMLANILLERTTT